jgi:hypothetical protein
MKKNVSDVERVLRFTGGTFLTSLAFWGPKNKWFLTGLVPIFTGLSGWCPLYAALGISTRKEEKEPKAIRQANRYMPVQSDSEEAAGHPIVGVS